NAATQSPPLTVSVPCGNDVVTVTVSAADPSQPLQSEALVTIQLSRTVTGKPAEALKDCWARQEPTDIPVDSATPAYPSLRGITLPGYLEELFEEVGQMERQALIRVLRLCQWRCGLPVPSKIVGTPVASEYSITPDEWRPTPDGSTTIRFG